MDEDEKNIVTIAKSQVKHAACMLARAFHDDLQLSCIIPDSRRRAEVLPHVFEFLVLDGIKHGVVHATSSDLEGIAIWHQSWKKRGSLWSQLHLNVLRFRFKVGGEVVSRMMFFSSFESSIRKRVAPYPHWYLSPLGVDPRCQGGGHAGRLMDAMLSRVDEENMPCCLETQNTDNIAFYRRYGFEVLDESTVPGTEVITWAMVRKKMN